MNHLILCWHIIFQNDIIMLIISENDEIYFFKLIILISNTKFLIKKTYF